MGSQVEAVTRYSRLSAIDADMPLNKFIWTTRGLKRSHISTVVQLHMGNVALNKYLHQIGKAESPGCLACDQREETVHHYLFKCPAWWHKRWHLSKIMGREAKSLSCLLGSHKGIKHLIKFTGG